MITASSRAFRKAPALGAVLLRSAMAVASTLTSSAGAATSTTNNLGSAAAASVLAGSGVTNTGPSVLALDLDTSPTAAITGFPPGVTQGTRHAADAAALAAQQDLTTAYNAAKSAVSTNDVSGSHERESPTMTQDACHVDQRLRLVGRVLQRIDRHDSIR